MPIASKFKAATDPILKRLGFTWWSGYDATKPKGRRQAPSGLVRDEDRELPVQSRRALLSATRDIHRNFSICAWAIRKHLDYVTSFRFKSKTGDKARDAMIEAFIAEAGRKENFDVAGRHGLRQSVRMSEARRVVDGDIAWLKLASGKTQIIEGDRIATPYAGMPDNISVMNITRGILTDDAGKALQYVLCRRAKTNDIGYTGQDLQFERMLPAKWVYMHACYDLGRFDQVRGISPLASAYNSFRDVYEGIDYALAKSKVSQIFGIKIKRNAAPEAEALGTVTESDAAADPGVFGLAGAEQYGETTVASYNTTERVAEQQKSYQIDPGRGPFMLDMDDGDDADVMESHTPSTEFQAFIPMVISIALKSLDIPFSWYDEAYVNFSGGKQATINYEKSAAIKRGEVQELLNDWTNWRLQIALDDGEIAFDGRKNGEDVAESIKYEWQPAGTPWLDPLKEAVGNIATIGAGLESPITVIEETTGRPASEIIEETAVYLKMRKDAGLDPPTWAVDPEIAKAPPGEAPIPDPSKSAGRKPGTNALTQAVAMATIPELIERRINGNGRQHE